VGEQAEALTKRLVQHRDELPGLSGPQLARLAARLIMDVRDGQRCEVELVILRKGRRPRTLLLTGRDDLDRIDADDEDDGTPLQDL
jgi:hypothetical protein